VTLASSPTSSDGRVLVAGRARGTAMVLAEPLSFWGGFDAQTGRVIDPRHPQRGSILSRRVLVMPTGRGSSSSASVLAEAVRIGTAPAAILLHEPDPILVLGAVVARELYGRSIPIVVLPREQAGRIPTGAKVEVEAEGGRALVRALPS